MATKFPLIERRAMRTSARTFGGARCRRIRCKLGVSQRVLAEVAGVSLRCLGKFERGYVKAQRSTVEAVFGALERFSGADLTQPRGAA